MFTLPNCPLSLDVTLCPPLPLVDRLVQIIVGAVKGTPVSGDDTLSTLCLCPSTGRLYLLDLRNRDAQHISCEAHKLDHKLMLTDRTRL